MMFVHSTSSGSQTAASELYKAGPLVATCALCSEASPVTEQEAVEIMRKAINGMRTDEAVENILNMFARTRNNQEYIHMVKKNRIV